MALLSLKKDDDLQNDLIIDASEVCFGDRQCVRCAGREYVREIHGWVLWNACLNGHFHLMKDESSATCKVFTIHQLWPLH